MACEHWIDLRGTRNLMRSPLTSIPFSVPAAHLREETLKDPLRNLGRVHAAIRFAHDLQSRELGLEGIGAAGNGAKL